jgi:hypothetical protein
MLESKPRARGGQTRRSDAPTAKWVNQKAIIARILALIAVDPEAAAQIIVEGVPKSDFSSHSKWDWEPGYGPNY